MKWITNCGHQLFSGLLACALLASAIVVSVNLATFRDRFADVKEWRTITDPAPPGFDSVEQANTDFANPPAWTVEQANAPAARGALFIPEEYIIGSDGLPIKARDAAIHTDGVTGKRIPNLWFMEHQLDWKAGNAPLQDPDKDGFTNADEWRYGTDPNSKDSHPPYYSKLFFKQLIRVPCRLAFKAFDGDARKPKTWEFQVETLDIRQPTSFLKIGEMVPNTKFKVERFEPREINDRKIGGAVDRSELTLIDTETNERIVLVLEKVTDAPDLFALFDYQWPAAAGEIRVRKLQDFGLRPESDKDTLYRLMDVNESEAQIRLPDGEVRTIGHDPRKLVLPLR